MSVDRNRKRPGNLPYSRGLSTDSFGPPGPHLMSHTVDTISALTPSLLPLVPFCTLHFSHFREKILLEEDVCEGVGSICVLHAPCTVFFSTSWELLCICSYISQDMLHVITRTCHLPVLQLNSTVAAAKPFFRPENQLLSLFQGKT